jgi:hypothetical protein
LLLLGEQKNLQKINISATYWLNIFNINEHFNFEL